MANDIITNMQKPLNIASIAAAVGCAVVGLVFRKKTMGIGLLFASVALVASTLAHTLEPTPVTGGTPRTRGVMRTPTLRKPTLSRGRAPVAPVREVRSLTPPTLGGEPITPEIYQTGVSTMGTEPAVTGVVSSEIYH